MPPRVRADFDSKPWFVNAWLPVLVGLWAAVFGLAPDLNSKLLVIAPVVLGAGFWWLLLAPLRWLGLFFACALLLPPLSFPFGNAGVHVAPLIVVPGLLVGMLRASEWRAARSFLPLLFLLFLAVLTGSVACAAFYSGASVAAGSMVRVCLFAIGVYVFLYTRLGPQGGADPVAFARLLFWLGLAGAAFACIDFYFQFPAPAGYAPQFAWLDHSIVRRAQGVFYEASTLGNFCTFFLTMILAAFFERGGARVGSRLLLTLGALVFGAALILSASRASVVAVIVAGVAFLSLRRFQLARILLPVFTGLAAATALVWLVVPSFSANYWLRISNSLRDFSSSPNGVLSGRLGHWTALTDFLLEHPWHLLVGIGYKTIPYTDLVGSGLVADNTWLGLLVETGMVGLVVFIFLNAAILRTAFRAARSQRGRASFFGAWIFCFWCGEVVQMFSGDLITYWRVLPVYFWVLATAARESDD